MVSSGRARTLVIACSIMGMACWWPFFRNSFLGMVIYGDAVSTDATMLYFAAIATLAVFSLIAFFASKSFSASPHILGVAALGFSVLFMVLGIALKYAGTQGALGLVAAFGSMVFVSLAAGCLTLSWFMAARRMPINKAFAIFMASFFVSFCIPYIAHFYGQEAMWWTNMSSLLVSSLCVVAVARLLPVCGWSCKDAGFNRSYDTNVREMVAVLVLFLIAGSIFRGAFSQGVLDYSPGSETEFRYIEALLFSAAVMAVSFFAASHRSFFTIAWMVFALMFLIGLLILSAIDYSVVEAGVSTVITARTFLALLLWTVLVQATREGNDSDALKRASIYFVLVEAVALILTGLVSQLVWSFGWAGFGERALSLWMAIALVFGSFVYLGRLVLTRSQEPTFAEEHHKSANDSVDASNPGSCDDKSQSTPYARMATQANQSVETLALERGAMVGEAARRAACARIARRYVLTERELDVLFAISQGHSVKKIAEVLFISTGTVQSHVKRLYRKTECHSRQDVIDLVDGEMLGE